MLGPEPDEGDRRWLAVEAAAAALDEKGPDEALTCVHEGFAGADLDTRLAAVRASGHPSADQMARAVAEFTASGAPRGVDQVIQLKVALAGAQPPIWRRVQVAATDTLGDLHRVIQALYGWDGDHLHFFAVGKNRYSGPFFDLEGTANEDELRVRDAFAPGLKKIMYTYDLGVCWRHEITLERSLARDQGRDYPACVGYQGRLPDRVLVRG